MKEELTLLQWLMGLFAVVVPGLILNTHRVQKADRKDKDEKIANNEVALKLLEQRLDSEVEKLESNRAASESLLVQKVDHLTEELSEVKSEQRVIREETNAHVREIKDSMHELERTFVVSRVDNQKLMDTLNDLVKHTKKRSTDD